MAAKPTPKWVPQINPLLTFLTVLSLFLHHTSLLSTASPPPPPSPHFDGFSDDNAFDDSPIQLTDLPPPPSLTPSLSHTPPPSPSSPFEYWDDDEFEGFHDLPNKTTPMAEPEPIQPSQSGSSSKLSEFRVEIVCVSFLIVFVINYFTGKKQNENLALSWAGMFATKDSIFDRNFSLLGVGEGDDSPLLLKEGQNVFRFYASGRRYCRGMLATMELKSRHDLISKIYNAVVPCNDEISFEVYMNDDAMDQVVFAVAKKKVAKLMLKEVADLRKFGSLVSGLSSRRRFSEDLAVVSESKEVASDLITEIVLDQVFGDKAFEKFGKLFISIHFSDQQSGVHRKKLMFKFALPDINHMADMTRLVALVPYYIDLVGRYKLSPQARSKTDGARSKAALEAYKEMQQARQEALQRKKSEKKKTMEEAEVRLSAEAIRKREAKERARQLKKASPKVKMSRA